MSDKDTEKEKETPEKTTQTSGTEVEGKIPESRFKAVWGELQDIKEKYHAEKQAKEQKDLENVELNARLTSFEKRMDEKEVLMKHPDILKLKEVFGVKLEGKTIEEMEKHAKELERKYKEFSGDKPKTVEEEPTIVGNKPAPSAKGVTPEKLKSMDYKEFGKQYTTEEAVKIAQSLDKPK